MKVVWRLPCDCSGQLPAVSSRSVPAQRLHYLESFCYGRNMAAEAQARLNVCLRDIISFYEHAGIDAKSLAMLESFIDRHLPFDFLSLAEGFGKCMAFINHDELIALLIKAFSTLIDGFVVERKGIAKKHKNLLEDKKADPAVIARLENLMADLDSRKQTAEMTNQRLKVMNMVPAALFRDPKFEPYEYYQKVRATHWREAAEAREAAAPHKKKRESERTA
jgi:hypothetical protein